MRVLSRVGRVVRELSGSLQMSRVFASGLGIREALHK